MNEDTVSIDVTRAPTNFVATNTKYCRHVLALGVFSNTPE